MVYYASVLFSRKIAIVGFSAFFIKPRKRAIEQGSFKFMSMDRVPGWDSVMGLQFETLVRNNLSTLLPLVGMGNTVLTSAALFGGSAIWWAIPAAEAIVAAAVVVAGHR